MKQSGTTGPKGVTPLDLVEFYHQLALLARARMPLPASLKQLALASDAPAFRAVLQDVSTQTDEGTALSEALGRHPDYFSPLHIRLLSLGETSNTLPSMLFMIARLSGMNQSVLAKMTEIAAYPIFVCSFAVFLLMALSILSHYWLSVTLFMPLDRVIGGRSVLSHFSTNFRMMVLIGGFIREYYLLLLIGAVIGCAVMLFRLRDALVRERMLLALVRYVPGARRYAAAQENARLCRIWSLLIEQKIPMPDVLDISRGIVTSCSLQGAFARMYEQVAKGESLTDVLASESAVDPLIEVAFRDATGETLGADLDALGELFDIRSARAISRIAQVWSVITFVAMVLFAILFAKCAFGMFQGLFVVRQLFAMGLL